MERVGTHMSNLDHGAESETTAAERLKRLLDLIPASAYAKIHACYHLQVPPHWQFADRINDDFHLIYIKGGEGSYTIEGNPVAFERGKIIFVGSGTQHEARQNRNRPPQIIPVRFGLCDSATGEPVRMERGPFWFELADEPGQELLRLFEKLHRRFAAGNDPELAVAGLIVTELLFACYMRLIGGDDAAPWDARLEKAKLAMEAAPGRRFDPSELAALAGLSEKYFRTRFKRQYGLTPAAWMTKVRMEYARFLLLEGGQSVKQIAEQLGYPDLYSFSKQFKQATGQSPLRWRLSAASSSAGSPRGTGPRPQ